MSKGRLLGFSLVAALLVPTVAVAQQQATTNYQSIVIEDFDSPTENRWVVEGGKFIADGYPRVSYVRTFPQALHRREPDGRELRALGVQAAFDRQGYNYLELIPSAEDENGEVVPRGIPIPGKVRFLDMWVWGSNFDYYMDIHLRDYRGMVHVIKLGDIRYAGWRNLRVPVPTWIPQDAPYIAEIRSGEFASDLRGLALVKIVVWTRPQERVNGFFIYLDEIKVETDLFRAPFAGEDLRDPGYVQELWAEGEGM